MINSVSKFVDPITKTPLRLADREPNACNIGYKMERFPRLDGKAGTFDLYDFRPEQAWVVQDRALAEANWKIISGFMALDRLRLSELGYGDLPAAVATAKRIAKHALSASGYFLATGRNLQSLIRKKLSGRFSHKADGVDSRHSSFNGYSKAYELVSYFAESNWLGWLDGHFTRAPMLLHHLSNMERLADVIGKWGITTVLEFGCGSGINLLLLQRLCGIPANVQLSGFDYPINRILTARCTVEQYDLEVTDLFCADGLNIPLADESFDLVYSQYVIEQLKGFEEVALKEMLRVARVGVVLFETALYKPTIDQRMFMAHSGYSSDLPRVVEKLRAEGAFTTEKIENLTQDRFYGCPNVQFVLRKLPYSQRGSGQEEK